MSKKCIGILTAGGDCPGLNAAIRGIGKAALGSFGMEVIGFRDGFRGLFEDRSVPLTGNALSGILTLGGTILGTSRDKPKKMLVDGELRDMTAEIAANYHARGLDALVCLGGGGTQKNAYHLMKQGLNIITLPKTIDNDVYGTDVSFGFDTALGIATEAIDKLHSTADSHHRIIVLEVMGHKAGWLALGAGLAGGADVILIPEIAYDVNKVAEAIKYRRDQGKTFSIVAFAEGAMSIEEAARVQAGETVDELQGDLKSLNHAMHLARKLELLTGLESRVTVLGHLQRGGGPSAGDRLLATKLGTACAEFLKEGRYGIMVASRGDGVEPVSLEEVAGKRKIVPLDHPWIRSARHVGTCFGD